MREADNDWGPLSGLPGNPIMWILIASELVVFGVILIAFSIVRLSEPTIFTQAQDQLAGAINTMVLLISNLFAAFSVYFIHDQKQGRAHFSLIMACILGVVFLIVKSFEYKDKVSAGISPQTNDFFMFCYLGIGFHALHVVFGILLAVIWLKANLIVSYFLNLKAAKKSWQQIFNLLIGSIIVVIYVLYLVI